MRNIERALALRGDFRFADKAAYGSDWHMPDMVDTLGRYEYTVEGWVDRFSTWRQELSKKFGAGQDVPSELLEGAALVEQAIGRRRDKRADERLAQWARERS